MFVCSRVSMYVCRKCLTAITITEIYKSNLLDELNNQVNNKVFFSLGLSSFKVFNNFILFLSVLHYVKLN